MCFAGARKPVLHPWEPRRCVNLGFCGWVSVESEKKSKDWQQRIDFTTETNSFIKKKQCQKQPFNFVGCALGIKQVHWLNSSFLAFYVDVCKCFSHKKMF